MTSKKLGQEALALIDRRVAVQVKAKEADAMRAIKRVFQKQIAQAEMQDFDHTVKVLKDTLHKLTALIQR